MEVTLMKLGNQLVITNPKHATSRIESNHSRSKLLSFPATGARRFAGKSENKKIKRQLSRLVKGADEFVFITKDPYMKFYSALVTIFVTGFGNNDYRRMMRVFERDEKLKGNFILDLQKKYEHLRFKYDEGSNFSADEIDGKDRYILIKFFSTIMSKAFQDKNIILDAHLRFHNMSLFLFLCSIVHDYGVDEEKISWIDLTSYNNPLNGYLKLHHPNYKKEDLKREKSEEDERERRIAIDSVNPNQTSQGWKWIMNEAYQMLSEVNPALSHTLSELIMADGEYYFTLLQNYKKYELPK